MFASLLHRFRGGVTAPLRPSQTERQQRGRIGEQIAAEYLRREARFRILSCNWSDGKQEIDLICRDGSVLVFVEVRAREWDARVPGFASLTKKKRRNLRKGAYAYLRTLRPRPHTYRYDAVELRMLGSRAEAIHHFRNIDVF